MAGYLLKGFLVCICTARVSDAVGVYGVETRLLPRQQLTFPPDSGPCPQNHGQAPFTCTESSCVDIPQDGVCHIQTSEGFPICGCCPAFDSLACSECGGDVGGGICAGTGSTNVAYQGCSCDSDGGVYPTDGANVCPENNGEDTARCEDERCGGQNAILGVCDNKTPFKDSAGKSGFVHCACCPSDAISDCGDCGGDDGNNKCLGLSSSYSSPYKGCECGKDGGIDIPPPIIPIPIPPAGFPIPPPGTPNPKKECPSLMGKCSECEGIQSWCQAGDNAGCPCQDECETNGELPTCSDESCKGDDGGKCTQGPKQDCDCTEDNQCPPADKELGCSECGGDNGEGKCRGLADRNDLWKDCDCWDDTKEPQPYQAFTDEDIAAAGAILAGLPDVSSMPPPPAPDPSKVTCWGNSVESVPARMGTETGEIDPDTLIYRLREIVCNDRCDVPAGINSDAVILYQNDGKTDCEISIDIDGNIEAWIYRGTPSQGDQWQQCWDSTENIIKKCIDNGPNKGWWNGPDFGQFYETGFRPINGEGTKHEPFLSDHPLKAPLPVITPSKNDGTIDCGESRDGSGSQMMSCLWPEGSVTVQNQRLDSSIEICTSDPDTNCISHGQNYNENGELLGSWCVVASGNGCAFVIADKDPHFGGGFTGNSCIKGSDFINMSIQGANQCSGDDPRTAIRAGPVNDGGIPAQSLCLVSSDHPEVCAVN